MWNAEETLFGLFLPAVVRNIFLGTDFSLNANILRCLFSWGGSLMVREPLSHCEAASLSLPREVQLEIETCPTASWGREESQEELAGSRRALSLLPAMVPT